MYYGQDGEEYGNNQDEAGNGGGYTVRAGFVSLRPPQHQ